MLWSEDCRMMRRSCPSCLLDMELWQRHPSILYSQDCFPLLSIHLLCAEILQPCEDRMEFLVQVSLSESPLLHEPVPIRNTTLTLSAMMDTALHDEMVPSSQSHRS